MTPTHPPTLPPRRKPAVLIVDDEQDNLGTFARSFRKDYTVHMAASTAAALAALDREVIDVVITDYTMPVMNGVELLRTVAARWPAVARVIVSGHADLAELHNAQRLGIADDLLAKPWRRPDVLRIVERLLADAARPTSSASSGDGGA